MAEAVPVKPQPLSAAAPASNLQLAYEVVHGPRGGAAVRGPRGGVAVRGPYGGAAVRGPYGGAAVRGPYGGRAAVGRPYYGGVWYGHRPALLERPMVGVRRGFLLASKPDRICLGLRIKIETATTHCVRTFSRGRRYPVGCQ